MYRKQNILRKKGKKKSYICAYCKKKIYYTDPFIYDGETYCNRDCKDKEVSEAYSHYRH